MEKKACEHEFVEFEGMWALTEVSGTKDKSQFDPSKGIPVVVQICKNCSEIKLFSAIATGRMPIS